MDESEVFSVVLEMTADAVFAIGVTHLNLSVISVLRFQSLRHFLVAIQALEGRSARAELMATHALGRATK